MTITNSSQGNTHYKVLFQILYENQLLTTFTQFALLSNYFFMPFYDIENHKLAKFYKL